MAWPGLHSRLAGAPSLEALSCFRNGQGSRRRLCCFHGKSSPTGSFWGCTRVTAGYLSLGTPLTRAPRLAPGGGWAPPESERQAHGGAGSSRAEYRAFASRRAPRAAGPWPGGRAGGRARSRALLSWTVREETAGPGPGPGPSLAPGLGLLWRRACVFGCDSFPGVGVLFRRLPAKPSPWPASRALAAAGRVWKETPEEAPLVGDGRTGPLPTLAGDAADRLTLRAGAEPLPWGRPTPPSLPPTACSCPALPVHPDFWARGSAWLP